MAHCNRATEKGVSPQENWKPPARVTASSFKALKFRIPKSTHNILCVCPHSSLQRVTCLPYVLVKRQETEDPVAPHLTFLLSFKIGEGDK
jgi:hypothetical protein